MSKHNLGQFYSTNVDRILEGMKIPSGAIVIEPFAGDMDLVRWSKLDDVEMYDIAPLHEHITRRDTLLDPPEYTGKFVLTNPPYRSRANNPDKRIYEKYDAVDLFYAFLSSIENADGGIVILPLIFFTAQKKMFGDARGRFMSSFRITRVNYFEEPVFDDTTTTIVSFQFVKSDVPLEEQEIEWNIYGKDDTTRTFIHKKKDNWLVGGYMFNLPIHPTIKISRHRPGTEPINFLSNITLRALDYRDSPINMKYIDDRTHKSKSSPGAYHTFEFDREFTPTQQQKIVIAFNDFLNEKRKEHHSLFMAMYREKTRRRLCLTLALRILSHVLLIHPELYE
jgi:hypothetical protein